MTIVAEIEAMSTAIDTVVTAWTQVPSNMSNPVADKVWRIKKYLELRQEILLQFVEIEN